MAPLSLQSLRFPTSDLWWKPSEVERTMATPPEHVLPSPVGEPAGPRSRRVYIRHDVEIRKYGVTIGCPECMAITAGTTAQRHSDECQARIEQKMREDVTGEGAMRLEEAIRRKRARLDDESGRADVAMEVAARNPIRPVQ